MFQTVSVSQQGVDLLKSRSTLMLTRPLATHRMQATAVRAGDIPCDTGLFEALRLVRKQIADAKNLPPYVVFSDVTLRHFCRDYPRNGQALLRIPGVGEKKLEDYGGVFLSAIAAWLQDHPPQEFAPLPSAPASFQAPKPKSSDGLNDTAQATLAFWRAGKSIPEIATTRGLAESTIENHLAQAIENGEFIDPRAIYSADEEREMKAALDGYDEVSLKPVFDQLEGRISYGKLRLYRAASTRLAMAGGTAR
jgi:ATP-dependent DNA helicase RecQ